MTIDYAEWVRRSLATFEFSLAQETEVPTNVVGSPSNCYNRRVAFQCTVWFTSP